MNPDTHDPYSRCHIRCVHELTGGVLVTQLLTHDGPEPLPPTYQWNWPKP